MSLSAADPVVPPMPPRPLSPIPTCLSGQALDATAANAAERAQSDSGSLDPAQRIAGLLVLSQLASGNRAGLPFLKAAHDEIEAQGWAEEAAAYLYSVATKIGESHVVKKLNSASTAEQNSWDSLNSLHTMLVKGRVQEFWINQEKWNDVALPADQRQWLKDVFANESAWDLRSPERRWLETNPRPKSPRPHSAPEDPVERKLLDNARINELLHSKNSHDDKNTPWATKLDATIVSLRSLESPAAELAALRLEARRAVVVQCDPEAAHKIQLLIAACDAKLFYRGEASEYFNLRSILENCGFTEPDKIDNQSFTSIVIENYFIITSKIPTCVCDAQFPQATLLCHLVASNQWWGLSGVDCSGLISRITANPIQQSWIVAQRTQRSRTSSPPWADMQQDLATFDRLLAEPKHPDLIPILHEMSVSYLLTHLPIEKEHTKSAVEEYERRWKAFADACPKEFKQSHVARFPKRITSMSEVKQ